MGYSAGESTPTVLLLACPKADLEGAQALCARGGFAVLPAGGAGDLRLAPIGASLFIVDVDLGVDPNADHEADLGSSRPVVRWHGRLGDQLPLDPQRFSSLLPPTWMRRHPTAYEQARNPGRPAEETLSDSDPWERQWELDGQPVPDDGESPGVQVFLPVIELEPLHTKDWIFTNELVPKQARRGRRFLPRIPTLVQLPA